MADLPIKEGLFHIPESPDDKPYLIGSRCRICSYTSFPTKEVCVKCRRDNTTEEIRLGPYATLETFAVMQVGPPGFPAPYIMGYVRMEESTQIFTLITGCEARDDALELGEAMELILKNRADLMGILDEVFQSRTLAEWKARLSEAGLPFGPVQNLTEVIADPQARANDYFIPFDHPTYGRMEVVANPVKLGKTPERIRMPAPEFSQHTEEILLQYGYTWKDIELFKEQRIIA